MVSGVERWYVHLTYCMYGVVIDARLARVCRFRPDNSATCRPRLSCTSNLTKYFRFLVIILCIFLTLFLISFLLVLLWRRFSNIIREEMYKTSEGNCNICKYVDK